MCLSEQKLRSSSGIMTSERGQRSTEHDHGLVNYSQFRNAFDCQALYDADLS